MKHYNLELIQLLARRMMSISQLAAQIFSGRRHLGLVLDGRRPGSVTWRKLKTVMTTEEYECARKFAADPSNAAKLTRNATVADTEASRRIDQLRKTNKTFPGNQNPPSQ